MARMIPALTEQQLNDLDSRAEANVYRLLRDELPDRVFVLHRVEWILRQEREEAGDGEADFLICDPDVGLLVLEVKGGGIAYDAVSDTWYSTDARAQTHEIKDPFRQAKAGKFAILAKLKEHRTWTQLGFGRVLLAHAVALPDLDDVSPFYSARSPKEIVAGRLELKDIRSWVSSVFAYWKNQDSRVSKPGPQVTHLVEQVFARTATARPLLVARLAEEEKTRVRLTTQQAILLSALGGRRRVAICGGAGTGKTLLAVEKAKRLAAEGFRTLLVCYNRPLAEYLARVCEGTPDLEVWSFHALCQDRCDRAKPLGRDLLAEAAAANPSGDYFDIHLPLALAYSTDVFPDRYDAVVVDEGQDFREEYWLPIEMLLSSETESPLYLFYDQNQALYTRADSFPIKDPPFVLTVNCRNTKSIHTVSYRFYRGEVTSPPETEGLPVECEVAKTLTAQTWAIQRILNRLVLQERVPAGEVAILVADPPHKATYYDALCGLPLPAGLAWSQEDHYAERSVLVETVGRFKGLERGVIILWVDGRGEASDGNEILYVGSSRAKSVLYVVGSSEGCAWAKCQLAGAAT
jgi:hypothetical protein